MMGLIYPDSNPGIIIPPNKHGHKLKYSGLNGLFLGDHLALEKQIKLYIKGECYYPLESAQRYVGYRGKNY